ncbi:hypothetical protein ES705_34820 [subsurface metagenome]
MKINKKFFWSLHRLAKKGNDKKGGKSITASPCSKKEKTIIKKKEMI